VSAQEAPKQAQGSKKWWLACCGGCAGLVIVLAVAIAVGLYFLLRARPVLPPETFLTASADGFAIVQVNPQDEQLVRMLQELVRTSPAGLRLNAEQRKRLQGSLQPMQENLGKLLPLHLVILFRHLPEEERTPKEKFALAGAFAIKGWSGLLRMFVKAVRSSLPEHGGRVEKYQGVKIGISPQGRCIAALDNNFMFARDIETIEAWIERIRRQKELLKRAPQGERPVLPYEGPEPLKRMLAELDPEAQLRFASLNSHGELDALLDIVASSAAPEGRPAALVEALRNAGVTAERVLAVGGTARLVGPDEVGVSLILECPDAASASALADALASVLRQTGEEGAVTDVRAEAEGARARVRFRASGVQAAIRKALRAAPQPAPTP